MDPERGLILCVMLWAREGREEALVAYEDIVLQLVPEHGGQVRQRARTDGSADGPFEIHTLEFPSDAALGAYMNDPRRVALVDERDRAIARTEIHRVTLV